MVVNRLTTGPVFGIITVRPRQVAARDRSRICVIPRFSGNRSPEYRWLSKLLLDRMSRAWSFVVPLYAAIDCGTNTFRLLISDGTNDLVRATEEVGLGDGFSEGKKEILKSSLLANPFVGIGGTAFGLP